MTTYRAKIPRFRCGYFRLWPCVPLFGPGGPVFKVRRSHAKFHMFVAVISKLGMCCATIVWKFRVFVAAISGLCVQCDRSRVKIPRFRCGYFRLVCVCVCVYVCLCVCVCVCVCAVTRHSRVKILCFHCGYFRLMCLWGVVWKFRVFIAAISGLHVCSCAFCLDRTGPASRCTSELREFPNLNWMCCHNSAFAIFGYS